MNKKIIGIGIVGLISAAIIVTGRQLSDSPKARIIDEDGSVMASVFMADGKLEYDCEDDVRVYVEIACGEAIELISQKENISEDEAEKMIVEKGYTIETVFRNKMFQAIKDACDKYSGSGKAGMTAAICDGKGRLMAAYMVGGQEKDNLLLKKAYAGSTIKPLSTYGPAIEDNTITWSSMYEDSPYYQQEDGKAGNWPVNTEPFTWENKAAAQGLVESNNAITVKVLSDFGIEKSCDFLEDTLRLSVDREQEWIREDIEKNEKVLLSDIGLGYLEQGVTMIEMLENYQVFAQGGLRYDLSALVGVFDAEGNRVVEIDHSCIRVFSEDTSYIMNRMLRRVVESGTGQSAQLEGIEVCGKTGTSENYQDNWFIGMTPEYVCGVWYGITDNERLQNDAINVFYSALSNVELDERKTYSVPENVEEKEYCLETGMLADDGCEFVESGYYKKGCVPDKCNR